MQFNGIPEIGVTMEIIEGSCRLGLWFVHVRWNDTAVYQVRFATTGIPGIVPDLIRRYCAGHVVRLSGFKTPATSEDTVYSRIYREVMQVPYGGTSTYGGIAARVNTSPRVVGQAMARNPVPLVIPCHRIVASDGIGGFSSPVEIKEALLLMEKKALRKGGK
jgi:methylated-DNA-[protein]-cysteine S-methyltransferase